MSWLISKMSGLDEGEPLPRSEGECAFFEGIQLQDRAWLTICWKCFTSTCKAEQVEPSGSRLLRHANETLPR